MTIIHLLKEIFVDRVEHIEEQLKKYGLDHKIFKFYRNLEKTDFNPQNNSEAILAATLLTNINTTIESVEIETDKMNLEYICADISIYLLTLVLKKSPKSYDQAMVEIASSLVSTCKANGWNYEILLKKLKFDLSQSTAITNSKPLDLIDSKIYYYSWQKNKQELDDLIYDLKDKKVIKSINDFKKIFESHNGSIKVTINKEKLDFLIILFDELHKQKLIKIVGTRGKYHPLKTHGIDFEKNVLIKNEPKHIKDRITKNASHYQTLLNQVEKTIGHLIK